MTSTTTGSRFELPPGGLVRLPGGRTVYVRDTGPAAGPTLLLLPGLMLSCDLNWFGALGALSGRFRLIAMDLPGHGRSPADQPPLRLTECADDAAALAAELGLGRVIPVGFSMGGLIAQLLWLRHREVVSGLVLCSTARNFRGSQLEQLTAYSLPGLTSALRLNPLFGLMGSGFMGSLVLGDVRDPGLRRWAGAEMERTSLVTTVSALREVTEFSSHQWIGEVDVPAAVVVTARDQVIPASRQRRLARAIPRAHVIEMDDDHGVFVNAPGRFAAALLDATGWVARAARRAADLPADLPAGRNPVL